MCECKYSLLTRKEVLSLTGRADQGLGAAVFSLYPRALCAFIWVLSRQMPLLPFISRLRAFPRAVLCPVALPPPLCSYPAFIKNLPYVRCDSGPGSTKTQSLPPWPPGGGWAETRGASGIPGLGHGGLPGPDKGEHWGTCQGPVGV